MTDVAIKAPDTTLDLLDLYGFDDALELDGVWRYLATNEDGTPNLDGTALLIAAFGNEEQQMLAVELRQAHQHELNDESNEAAKRQGKKLNRSLLVTMLAATVLKGWKKVVYGGKELEYSQANAEMLLGHRKFREVVLRLAMDESQYRTKGVEEDRKNSLPPTNGG